MYQGPAKVVITHRTGYIRLVRVPNRTPSFIIEEKSVDSMGEPKWDRTPDISMKVEYLLEELLEIHEKK